MIMSCVSFGARAFFLTVKIHRRIRYVFCYDAVLGRDSNPTPIRQRALIQSYYIGEILRFALEAQISPLLIFFL